MTGSPPRPLVAVTGMRSASVHGLRRRGVVASEAVLEAVHRGGGAPVVLAPLHGATVPDLTAFGAVVVPGGADLDPSFYGGGRSDATEPSDPVQDRFDLAVSRAVLAARVPVLAICRGMQVLNVALGGSLVDHLPEGGAIAHRDAFHRVTLDPGCAVALAMGTTEPIVSSYHHQALDRLGEGLHVVGRADDGCIEAVAHAVSPVLAVQWHPEDDAISAPAEQRLFDALVEQAAVRTAGVALSGDRTSG